MMTILCLVGVGPHRKAPGSYLHARDGLAARPRPVPNGAMRLRHHRSMRTTMGGMPDSPPPPPADLDLRLGRDFCGVAAGPGSGRAAAPPRVAPPLGPPARAPRPPPPRGQRAGAPPGGGAGPPPA